MLEVKFGDDPLIQKITPTSSEAQEKLGIITQYPGLYHLYPQKNAIPCNNQNLEGRSF